MIEVNNRRHIEDLKTNEDKSSTLNLDLCKLTSLPASLFHGEDFGQLAILSVCFNEIASLDESGLFATNALVNLTQLKLSNNQLASLDAKLFTRLGKLRHLDLSHNRLSDLNVDQFDGLTCLEVLYLSNNSLSQIDASQFTHLTRLRMLSLSNNSLSYLHPDTFNELVHLTDLVLSGNGLTSLDATMFRSLIRLKRLRLDNNLFESLDGRIFGHLCRLEQLSLYGNKLSALEEGIFHPLRRLTELDLGANKLTKLDVDAFKNLANLQVLTLSRNNLRSLHPMTFHKLNKLTKLWLLNNRLVELNVGLFHGLEALTGLCISGNRISRLPPGIFDHLKQLRQLWLDGNQLTSLDGRLFSKLEDIRELWLNNNVINELDVRLFRDLNRLRIITLHDNKLASIDRCTFSCLPKEAVECVTLHGNTACRFESYLAKTTVMHFVNRKQVFLDDFEKFLGQFVCDERQSLVSQQRSQKNKDDSTGRQLIADRYELKQYLGGNFYSCFDRTENIEKGLLLLQASQIDKNDYLDLKILTTNRVEYSIDYLDYFKTDHLAMIITESLIPYVTLMDVIDQHTRTGTVPSGRNLLGWTYQITLGLKELHYNGIIHRNITPASVFLDQNGKIKIGLVEFDRVIRENLATDETKCDQLNYASPELIRGQNYSFKTDIWSLGCVVYELMYLRRLAQLDDLPKLTIENSPLHECLIRMLRIDAGQRVSSNALCRYLKEIIENCLN